MVVKMPACKIVDLASAIIEMVGNSTTSVRHIGIRSGEKIHEILISRYETSRVIRSGEWFIILPMLNIPKVSTKYSDLVPDPLEDEYSSLNADQLTIVGIKKLLELSGFFQKRYVSSLSLLGPDDLLNYFKKEGWIRN
jgi:FlaA1/EpsC-like NDP-sugar epimerase